MDEQLLRDAIHDYCATLLAIARSFKKRTEFFDHATKSYSLSKTRAGLYLNFAEFHTMCRDANMLNPSHPDSVAPILALPKKQWLEVWKMVLDCGQLPTTGRYCGQLPNAYGVKAVLDRFNISPKRIPKHILERKKVQRAAQTLAEVKDGEALADRVGFHGFGRHWGDAVNVVIEADQRRMDLADEASKKRAKLTGVA